MYTKEMMIVKYNKMITFWYSHLPLPLVLSFPSKKKSCEYCGQFYLCNCKPLNILFYCLIIFSFFLKKKLETIRDHHISNFNNVNMCLIDIHPYEQRELFKEKYRWMYYWWKYTHTHSILFYRILH